MNDKIGRFLSVDKVGAVDAASNSVNEQILLNPQRLNRYAYGLNNPYRYVDPDGNLPNLIYDIPDIGFFAHSAYKMITWTLNGTVLLNGEKHSAFSGQLMKRHERL